MFKVRIISVGKQRDSYLAEGEEEYRKRLRPFMSIEVVETGTVKSADPERVKREEGRMALQKTAPGELFIALEERGKLLSSVEFAALLEERLQSGHRSCAFGIGGPSGWHESVLARAGLQLSLSPMTFPHRLVRLILMEQLYRAATLWHSIPYHK